MSSRALAVTVALAAAGPVRAQVPEARNASELRTLVARLDSQLVVFAAARVRAEQATAPRRTARLAVSGDVVLALWDVVPDSLAQALARRADSILAASGVVPAAFTRSLVFVMQDATDTAAALAVPEVAGRRARPINIPVPLRGLDDWWVLDPLLGTFAASLDPTWTDWSQNAWGFVRWRTHEAAERGGRELTAPRFTVADRCLSGEARGCRLFLGVDADAHPYRDRFTPAERRSMLEGYYGGYPGVVACRNGDDAACVRALENAPYTGTGGIPAGGDTRAGLLAALAALHGPVAVQVALADRQGSVGERLARAAGVSEDSLMLEWRAWALSGGRPYHVRAGFGDLAAALVAVSLLVFLATRSGRWH